MTYSHALKEELTNLDLPRYGIRTWLGRFWRWFWALRLPYWLRCHTFTRYHVIDVSGEGGYDWGWLDRSHAVLLVNFKLLCEFIEREHPDEHINWDSDPEHRHARDEMQALYEWWRHGRADEERAVEEFFKAHHRHPEKLFTDLPDGNFLWNPGTWDSEENEREWLAKHDGLEARDDEMLRRLIDIRGFLWT